MFYGGVKHCEHVGVWLHEFICTPYVQVPEEATEGIRSGTRIQAVVSCPVWVLGTESGSCERSVSTLFIIIIIF